MSAPTSYVLADVLIIGDAAARAGLPCASDSAGRIFVARDTATIYYDNGASWEEVLTHPRAHTHARADIAGLVAPSTAVAFTEGGEVLYREDGSIATLRG